MPTLNGSIDFQTLNGIPLNKLSYYRTASERLAPNQKRHESWDYYQTGLGKLELLPLDQCFLADGVTPATNRGTWGTRNEHWRSLATLEAVQGLLDALQLEAGEQSPGMLQFGYYDKPTSTFKMLRDASIPDDAVFRVLLDELPPNPVNPEPEDTSSYGNATYDNATYLNL